MNCHNLGRIILLLDEVQADSISSDETRIVDYRPDWAVDHFLHLWLGCRPWRVSWCVLVLQTLVIHVTYSWNHHALSKESFQMSSQQLIMYLAIPYIFFLSLFLVRTKPTYSKIHGADVKIANFDEFPLFKPQIVLGWHKRQSYMISDRYKSTVSDSPKQAGGGIGSSDSIIILLLIG